MKQTQQAYSIVVAAMVLLLAGCSLQRSSSVDTRTIAYDWESLPIHPAYFVHHVSNDSSDLYVKLSSKELLYARRSPESPFTARIRCEVAMYKKSENQFVFHDSLTLRMEDTNPQQTERIVLDTKRFRLDNDASYRFDFTLIDENRRSGVSEEIEVVKTASGSREDFLVFTSESKPPIMTDVIPANASIHIDCPRCAPTIRILQWDPEVNLPPPPYTEARIELPTAPKSGSELIQLDRSLETKEGGLFTVANENGKMLFSLLIADGGYPRVETLDEMIASLRYISGRREFERLESANNQKKELDSFWLDCGGTKDRTRELIRIYYQRVQEANYYFSGLTEGWRTDRGLMHIIFGNPNRVKRDSNGEIWIYGEESNINSMSFRFERVSNPFTRNHYVLERNPLYRPDWDRAVTAWRNGRVFQE